MTPALTYRKNVAAGFISLPQRTYNPCPPIYMEFSECDRITLNLDPSLSDDFIDSNHT